MIALSTNFQVDYSVCTIWNVPLPQSPSSTMYCQISALVELTRVMSDKPEIDRISRVL